MKINWRLCLYTFVGWSLIGWAYTYNYSHYWWIYKEIFSEPPGFLNMLVWELPYWFLWVLLSPLVFWLTRRFRLERGLSVRNSIIHLTACFSLSLVHRVVYLFIAWACGVDVYVKLGSLGAVYTKHLFFNLPNGFLCYVTILLAGTYYRHHQEEELKISRLTAEVTQAQLLALKMQLHPHFLFNTLNSISSLMDEDVKAAEKMLGRLGNFLRMTLDNSGAQEVTLQKELEFLRSYLEIERVRFPDHLTVDIDADPETYEAMVPNLILQPIVENAIQHGFMRGLGDGHIEIHARRDGDWLHLEVHDSGPGTQPSNQQPGRGLGLKLTRERLERLYGSQQKLSFSPAPSGGTRVRLSMPYSLSSDSAVKDALLSKVEAVAV